MQSNVSVDEAQPMGKLYKESYANTYAALNVRNALDKLINVLQSPQEKRSMFVRTGAAAAAAARDRARPTETPSSPSAASTAAPASAKIGSSTRPVSPGSSGASAFDTYAAGGAQETCTSSRLSGSCHGRGSHLAANYHEPTASYHGSSSSACESDNFYGSDRYHEGGKSRDQCKIRGSTPPLTENHLGKKTHVRDGSQTSEYSENCEFVGHIPPLLHDKVSRDSQPWATECLCCLCLKLVWHLRLEFALAGSVEIFQFIQHLR